MTKKTRTQSKTSKPRSGKQTTTEKGRMLERIAALMHEKPGVTVERNKRLPPVHSKGGTREIDVLLTTSVAGYPVRLAIECKNEKGIIKPDKIDAFVGKLQYVGIPPQQGIYITTSGYAKGAIERAAEAGIRLLRMRGLKDEDLLRSITGAFQSVIYLLCQIIGMETSNEIDVSTSDAHSFYNEKGEYVASIPDLICQMWLRHAIPTTLGEHDIDVQFPTGLHQMFNGKPVTTYATEAKVRVLGLVVTLEGRANEYSLVNAASGEVERGYVDVTFDPTAPERSHSIISTFTTEDDLQLFLHRPGTLQVAVGRLMLPRILFGAMYWPASERVANILIPQLKAFEMGEIGELPMWKFEDLEGTDFGTIFEPIWEGNSSMKVEVTEVKVETPLEEPLPSQ